MSMNMKKIIGMTVALGAATVVVTPVRMNAAAQNLDQAKIRGVFDNIARFGKRVNRLIVLNYFTKIAHVALQHSELIIAEARSYFSEELHHLIDNVEEAFNTHKNNKLALGKHVVPRVIELFKAHAELKS